jgi:hypothetical protein
MGSRGTIIQNIETLETDGDIAQVARANRDKLNPKAFKKNIKGGTI